MGQTGALCPQGQAEKALDPVSAIRGPHTRGRTRKWEPLPPGGRRLPASDLPAAGRPARHSQVPRETSVGWKLI